MHGTNVKIIFREFIVVLAKVMNY